VLGGDAFADLLERQRHLDLLSSGLSTGLSGYVQAACISILRGGMAVNGETRHRRTQAQRSQTTRAALLASGRALFAAHGFAGTAREDVVARAGVTRGALHHHFGTKQQLFAAVFETLEQELATRIATAAMAGRDPFDQLRRGCHEFLDAALDPAVQRIVLLDAPAVLGWAAWREIDARYGLGLVTEGLRAVFAAGPAAPRPVEPLAHLLLAALNEAAMLVAGATDPARARAEVGAIIDHLLGSLTRPPS
jgi:AcrR family transcriptional regulator